MLAMTDTAAEAIRGIVAAPGVPDGAGLRITQAIPGPDHAPGALEVTIAELPQDADQVVDEEGARVFLDPAVIEQLDDKLLDAQLDGTRVGFLLTEQPPG